MPLASSRFSTAFDEGRVFVGVREKKRADEDGTVGAEMGDFVGEVGDFIGRQVGIVELGGEDLPILEAAAFEEGLWKASAAPFERAGADGGGSLVFDGFQILGFRKIEIGKGRSAGGVHLLLGRCAVAGRCLRRGLACWLMNCWCRLNGFGAVCADGTTIQDITVR